MKLTRRGFIELAGAAGAGAALSGCALGVGSEIGRAGLRPSRAAVTSPGPNGDRAGAIREAVEAAGGMEWLQPGDRVLIKPAQNSGNAYPFTASPVAVAELVRMCIERGAGRVIVADCLGVENSLLHGEEPFGLFWTGDLDVTLGAFRSSGLLAAVQAVTNELGVSLSLRRRDGGQVVVTSFRDDRWHRVDTGALTNGLEPRLRSGWVEAQIARARENTGETWDGNPTPTVFLDRKFDETKWFGHDRDHAGMWLPNVFDEVDHIINVFRVSTHTWSGYTMAIKNWIGVQRPDDRLWMHQLNFIKNTYGTGDDPLRHEMAYHELLAELHLPAADKEKLFVADASEIIVSGGPDETDKRTFPAWLCLAATDMVAADVTGLSILRQGVLRPPDDLGGLGGVCEPQPQTFGEQVFEAIGQRLPWYDGPGAMRGTDSKLCDPSFSNWDWVCIQRARELGLGAQSPSDLELSIAQDGEHAVDPGWASWIREDVARPPVRSGSGG